MPNNNNNGEQKGLFCSTAQAYKLADLPSISSWENLPYEEVNYRKYMLEQIAKRVSQQGVRTCKTCASRAKQFMPYAALTGYENVIDKVVCKNNLTN